MENFKYELIAILVPCLAAGMAIVVGTINTFSNIILSTRSELRNRAVNCHVKLFRVKSIGQRLKEEGKSCEVINSKELKDILCVVELLREFKSFIELESKLPKKIKKEIEVVDRVLEVVSFHDRKFRYDQVMSAVVDAEECFKRVDKILNNKIAWTLVYGVSVGGLVAAFGYAYFFLAS